MKYLVGYTPESSPNPGAATRLIMPKKCPITLELPSDDAPSSVEYTELKKKFKGSSEELRSALFGDTCFLCGMKKESGKKIPLHRKDGRPHDNKLIKSEKYFRTLNPDEWVTICQKHHRLVHWAMEKLKLEWHDFATDSKKK